MCWDKIDNNIMYYIVCKIVYPLDLYELVVITYGPSVAWKAGQPVWKHDENDETRPNKDPLISCKLRAIMNDVYVFWRFLF